ncbi:MAG TPA: DUF5658 family protein [Gemmatales bacterium]|nr:DUF5658 family protein [Gemmatales bacterium]
MSSVSPPNLKPPRDSWPGWLRPFAAETSRLQGWIILLVLVSMADLIVTYFLLSLNADFYESNPIANWFFKHWNIAGMTFFKFAVVMFVIIVAEVAERQRPGFGKFVLIFGVLVTAAVVTYSVRLYMGFVSDQTHGSYSHSLPHI